MKLAPKYQAQRYGRQVQDSVTLAMKTRSEQSLALLIDTAIESRAKQRLAESEVERGGRHH